MPKEDKGCARLIRSIIKIVKTYEENEEMNDELVVELVELKEENEQVFEKIILEFNKSEIFTNFLKMFNRKNLKED